MRLADFILANLEPILVEWESFARSIWPGASTDPATLRDHAEEMLRATALDMASGQTSGEQSDKSRGKSADVLDRAGIDRASAAHGVGRVASGFELTAVLAEYRALRASVIRLWGDAGAHPDAKDLDDLTRFNESIDQSLAEAVNAYAHHVDHDRTSTMAELRSVNEALLVSSVRQNELMEQASLAAVELREARDAAETANRAKDTFIAVLSHELRTPLTPVVMMLSAIEIDPDLPFKFREDLLMMRRNLDLELKLIDDLLDLSRVTSGKLRLNIQPVHAHEVLAHVIRSGVSEASGKRLHVQQDLAAQTDLLRADPARLQQVFWNLLRNAVKFTPEGGDVTVRTWNCEDDTSICIEVRDNGVGIEPELLPRIFGAFEQGEMRTMPQFGGLGLGLAIAKAVVEMHGGTISASSDGRDSGSTFTVTLKTEVGQSLEGDGRPPIRSAQYSPTTPRLRVLLVEDHPDTSRVLTRLLRGLGYEVAAANTASSALHLAATRPFDLILSDIGLPDATGYELMEMITERHGIKGIALSGYGMEDDLRKSRAAGFLDHVVKPINLMELQAIIQRVAAQPTPSE